MFERSAIRETNCPIIVPTILFYIFRQTFFKIHLSSFTISILSPSCEDHRANSEVLKDGPVETMLSIC
jgi:hypothetical protein